MTARERREANRAIATAFVAAVEAETHCRDCGVQPVEWHNPSHVEQPNARVSSLRTQGASVERIQREIDACVPLCRSCHMKEDGRMDQLRATQPNQPGVATVEPKPCLACGKPAKPTRRGRCSRCYNQLMGIRQPMRSAA